MKNLVNIFLLSLFSLALFGQFQEEEEENSSIFIGGLSPFILDQGQVEINNQSYLVSYRNIINTSGRGGSISSNIYRYTLFQNQASVYYGFSDSKKWDLGFDLTYVKNRWDDSARLSPFKVFNDDEINNSGISTIGAKIRFAPFSSQPGLVFIAGTKIPMANGNEQRRNLNAERMQFSLTGSYYQAISYDYSYFLQFGWSLQPAKTNDELGYFLPTAHNLNGGAYLTMNLWERTLYFIPGLSYSGSYQHSVNSSKILQRSHAVFMDFIIQYQFSSAFSINLQTSYPLLFESHIPYIAFERTSYSAVALSIRMVF
jgi:hypothetical protein